MGRQTGRVTPASTVDRSHELGTVRASLQRIASTAFARLPRYRHLAERAAVDDEVAARLLLAAPDDRNPTLLFAAVHDVLLADPSGDEPLAAWYPSVTDDPRPLGGGPDDPWPHFRRLALDHPDVERNLATRGTQTNEVGRCATTVPALGLVQHEVDRPIALIEVGASAGLNLRLDAYGYRWRPDGGDGDAGERRLHADRPVVLGSRWRGDRPPPATEALPVITHRVGVDRDPVDVTDPTAVRWLIACQWPDQVDRLARCRAALDGAVADPPPVRRGDLLAEVGDLVRAAPLDAHPVVLSTWVLTYLGVAGQRAFLAELDRVAADRDLTLLVQEEPSVAPGLDLPDRPGGGGRPGPTALCRLDWQDGRRRSPVRLADQHPHGTWSEWFA